MPESDAITRIEAISRETGVFVVVGVIEKDIGTLYCTIAFVDPVQGYITKHRKLLPTAAERFIWGQGDATTLAVPEVSFSSPQNGAPLVKAKLSATICW